MNQERLDRVIEIMAQIPPLIHRKLHRAVFRIVLEELGADIAPHHMMILKTLQREGTLHSKELGEMTAVAKAQVTHSIDRLIRLGLVERHPDTLDRRRANITLTDRGRNTLQRLDEIMKERLKARLSALKDEELEKLADSFGYIAETFSRLQ